MHTPNHYTWMSGASGELVQSSDGHCIAKHSWQGCLPPPANTFKGCPYLPTRKAFCGPRRMETAVRALLTGGQWAVRLAQGAVPTSPCCRRRANRQRLTPLWCVWVQSRPTTRGVWTPFGPWPLAWGWFALGLLLGAAFVTCVWCAWASWQRETTTRSQAPELAAANEFLKAFHAGGDATTKVGGCRPCTRGRQCAGRIARSPPPLPPGMAGIRR